MKRWLNISAAVLLTSYIVAYRFLPWRRADRFRNAEVFVHTREFRYDWEAQVFYPAAYIEWLLIRAHPRHGVPIHPGQSTGSFCSLRLISSEPHSRVMHSANRPNQALERTAARHVFTF